MDYMTVKEASVLWQMDVSTIGKLLRKERISGATKNGDHWFIPKGSPRPADGRSKKKQSPVPGVNHFRFPLYVNADVNSYNPPLSAEELALRLAQKDFFACEFGRSKDIFYDLAENAVSLYVRLSAQLFSCLISVCYDDNDNFEQWLGRLHSELKADFPYKNEMMLLLPWFDSFLFMSVTGCMTPDVTYNYDQSVRPLAVYLTAYHLKQLLPGSVDASFVQVYEFQCAGFEQDGFYYEVQELHMLLFTFYIFANNKEQGLYHLRKAVDIAKEYNLLYSISAFEFYYPAEFNAVLSEYPPDFIKKVRNFSLLIHSSSASFMEKHHITKLYSALSRTEIQLTIYALRGLSNKQVAGEINVSERTVANIYSAIYGKLNIAGKPELVEMAKQMISASLIP